MLIAVFSDSHDNMENIKKAVELAKERGITRGLHLGDFCAPPTLTLLATSGLTWQCVWGNVDGDKLLSYQRVQEHGTMDLVPEDFRELEIEGRKLFLTHYPQIARIAALSGSYDATFHGHNHEANQEVVGKTLLANPGEIAGFRFGKPSFGIYDTETNTFEHVYL
jgi:putative phosphoesterase